MRLGNTDLPDEIGGVLGVVRRIRIATRPPVTICDGEPNVVYLRSMAVVYGIWAIHDDDPREITAALCNAPNYTVTHKPTGRLVADELTLARAVGLVERLLALPTFRTMRELRRRPELLGQLRAAAENL